MELNVVLIIIGLIVCFGGIYIRRLASGLIGFIWGCMIGLVMLVMDSGALFYIDEQSKGELLAAMLIVGGIIAVLSIVFERLSIAINTFVFIVIIIEMLIIMSVGVVVVWPIALVVALVGAGVAYYYDKYACIIVTAFAGAFIASLGFWGITNDLRISEIYIALLWAHDLEYGVLYIGTIVLGCVGCIVQCRRLRIRG